MSNQIRKTDVDDIEFLDAEELQSDGSFVYLSTGVVSTDAATKVVTIALPSDGEGILRGRDHPVEPGDVVYVAGTSGGAGDGQFTVAAVLTDVSFSVAEAIGSSTGGNVNFHYVAGARRIGFDPTGSVLISARNVQGAIRQLEGALDGVNHQDHQTLRQLIHLADEGGPFEGFPSGVYQETLPAASAFPTSVIWWVSAAKVAKIVEETITYNPNATVAVDNWKVYAEDGVTLRSETTDVISYSGVFETSRTRTIVEHNVSDGPALTSEQHKNLRQLVHLVEQGGPFEGFASGAYQETLPPASAFPTSVIWWVSAAKTAKIVEESISYNPNGTVSTTQWRVYGVDGSTVIATVTDTISYSGVFETSRTRAIA